MPGLRMIGNYLDRAIYQDPVNGCRYVVLDDHRRWYLWVDIVNFRKKAKLKRSTTIPDGDTAFLPLDFIPGQGQRLTIVASPSAEIALYPPLKKGEEPPPPPIEGTRYLVQQHGAWYLRVRVPADLRSEIGKLEIVRSLGTRSLVEAQARRAGQLGEVTQWFDQIRAEREGRVVSQAVDQPPHQPPSPAVHHPQQVQQEPAAV